MGKKNLLLFISLSTFIVKGQETFWKRYNFDGSSVGPHECRIFPTIDSGFIYTGYYYDDKSVILKEQNDTIVYCKNYKSTLGGTQLYSFLELPDKGLISSGFSQVSFGNNDIYIMRTDSLGNIIWGKSFGASGTFNMSSVVPFESFNKFIMTGYAQGFMGVVIFDLAGNIISSNRISGTNGGKQILRTNDNGFILAGGKTQTDDDIILVKLDSLGTIQWSKTYAWTGNDVVYSIIPSLNNGFLVSGTTSVIDSNGDLFLMEVDSVGNLLWSKVYNASGYYYPYQTTTLLNSSYLICNGNNFSGEFNNGLLRVSDDGTVDWSWMYTNSYHDYSFGLLVYGDSSIIISGEDANVSSLDYMSVIKLNLNGFLSCFQDSLPITIYLNTPAITSPVLGYVAMPITLSSSTNTINNSVLSIDTICYCPNLPSIDFTYDTCYIDSVNFYSNIPSSTYISLQWDFGDGTYSTAINPIHFFPSTGPYSVSLTVVGSASCSTTVTHTIMYNPNIGVSGFTYIISDSTVSFMDTSLYSSNWYWDFGDGNMDSIQNSIHQYDSSGTYQVCLTVGNNCYSDTICDSVFILIGTFNPELIQPFIFLKAFPNPFKSQTIISFPVFISVNYSIFLYDIFGNQIFRDEKITGKEYALYTPDLNSGIYVLELKDQFKKTVGHLKLIIQK